MARGLEACGLLTPLDKGIFASYCIAYDAMLAAHAEGSFARYMQAQAAMRMAANELGLTPASRSRMVVDGGEKKPDEWAELIPT